MIVWIVRVYNPSKQLKILKNKPIGKANYEHSCDRHHVNRT